VDSTSPVADVLKQSEFAFTVASHLPGWFIHYNSFTGAYHILDAVESDQFHQTVELLSRGHPVPTHLEKWRTVALDGGFVVPSTINEREEVKRRYRAGRANTHGLSLTIAPTISCNFGCSYCFQEHPKRTMSSSDVDALVAFAHRSLRPNTLLFVTWFGGEPLAAFHVIRGLAPRLRELAQSRGCRFRQTMISNGYLLTRDVVDWLGEHNDLEYIQITLDGPPSDHDARRPLANGRPTFDRILANVVSAAERLTVVIRVNVDRRNVDGLNALIERLIDAGLRGRVGLYLGHTEAYTEVCSSVHQHALSREEFAAAEVRFRFALMQRGWFGQVSVPKPAVGGLCIADNPNGHVLAPGGLAFKCWNEVAESAEVASSVLQPEGTLSTLSERGRMWRDFDPFFHSPCATCRVQPLCRGGCPWESMKNDSESPGHCTTYRFNIEDVLRLVHLERVTADTFRRASNVGATEGGVGNASRRTED
jgi:uncharacterized protein